MFFRLSIKMLTVAGLLLSGAASAQDESSRPITTPDKVQSEIQAQANMSQAKESALPFAGPAEQAVNPSPFGGAAEPERPRAMSLTPTERLFLDSEESLLREIRLLDLQIEVADRQKKLSEPTLVQATVLPVAMAQATDAAATAPRGAERSASTAPLRLASIWGTPENLKAEFITPVGNRVVGIGERVHDGWELESLHQAAAIVRKGRQKLTLKMGI